MALIEGFPDSPRISFSHDLAQNDAVVPVAVAVAVDRIRSNSSSVDFDFCVLRESSDQEHSSADELFAGGKILPVEIKKRLPPAAPPPPRQVHEPIPIKSPDSSEGGKPSFWRIKRSTSLNCGSGYAATLCPLPILSRSNSTGSACSAGKRAQAPNCPKQNLAKYSSHSNSPKPPYSSSSKPPLKKSSHSHAASYSAGVIKISPIINVVPPANLFGLGSIFSGSKKK